MKIKKLYGTNTSFIDLLFNMLLAFTALFVLSFAMMNQEKQQPETKGAYLITVSWPENIDDDIDLYTEDPDGHLVFFRRREDGLMHLDRDDLGVKGDKVSTKFGIIDYKDNREIVTLRETSRGEYCVNIHVYIRHTSEPFDVLVQLDKIYPSHMPIVQKSIKVLKTGQETTAFRFTLDAKGEVISVNYDEKSLIKPAHGQANGYTTPSEIDFDPSTPLE